jgi:hypothetical protein
VGGDVIQLPTLLVGQERRAGGAEGLQGLQGGGLYRHVPLLSHRPKIIQGRGCRAR